MLALPPDVVQWVSRNGQDGDCAIAAIMLATGASYEAVMAEAIRHRADAVTYGMNWRQIRVVCKRLGFSTRLRRKFDLDEDSGILDCRPPGTWGKADHVKLGIHVVYLWAGRVIEPRDQSYWLNPEDFLLRDGWTPGQLLTLKKD